MVEMEIEHNIVETQEMVDQAIKPSRREDDVESLHYSHSHIFLELLGTCREKSKRTHGFGQELPLGWGPMVKESSQS